MHFSLLLYRQNVFPLLPQKLHERASTKCEKKRTSLDFSSILSPYHFDLRVSITIKLNRHFVIYPPHTLAYI